MATFRDFANDPRSTDELFSLAAEELIQGSPESRTSPSALVALQHRPTREVLDGAIERCGSSDQDERLLGVAVLAEIRELEQRQGENPAPAFVEESVTALMELAAWETDDEVLAEIARAYGYRRSPRPLLQLLSWLEHPTQGVRFSVACALPSCSTPDTEDLVAAALIQLTRDESGAVRDYALFGFPQLSIDTSAIRQAMLDRLSDPDESAARQALANLAVLRDERAVAPLIAHLNIGGLYGFEAAGHLAHPDLLPALRAAAPDTGSGSAEERASAIAACETGTPVPPY